MRKNDTPKVSAIADLRAFLATRSRAQLWAAGLSVLITLVVMTAFLVESRWGYLPPDPLLIYADSWKEGRSAEQVYEARKREMAEKALVEAQAKAEAHANAAAGAAKPEAHADKAAGAAKAQPGR